MISDITNEDLYTLIRGGNEEIKREIGELRNHLKTEIEVLKLKNVELEKQNLELKNKLSGIERKLKKFNVIVYGIENGNDTAEEVLKILNENLNIDCSINDFRDIYRIGKPAQEKIRPVVLEALNYNLKSEILAQAKLHANTLNQIKVYFSHEYTTEDYQKRKFLIEQLKVARNKQYKAIIRNNSLIINGQEFSYEYLKTNGLISVLTEIQTEAAAAEEDLTEALVDGTPLTQNNPSRRPEKDLILTLQQNEEKKRKLEESSRKETGTKPKAINTRSQTHRTVNRID